MNKEFENTFDVKFDEKAIKTFKDLIKEKGIRHFKLESDLYGVLDVVLYEEYQKIEQQLDKYKKVIDKILKLKKYTSLMEYDEEFIKVKDIKKLLEEVE